METYQARDMHEAVTYSDYGDFLDVVLMALWLLTDILLGHDEGNSRSRLIKDSMWKKKLRKPGLGKL